MRTVIVVHALGRSGHHAVIDWIRYQFQGHNEFFNNAFMGWDKQRLCSNYYAGPDTSGSSEGDDLLQIFSLEDSIPSRWEQFNMNEFPVIKEADRVVNLFVVRDHYNWGASSYAYGVSPDMYHINETGFRGMRMDIAKMQYREVLGETAYVTGTEKLFIDFGKWFCLKFYRKRCAETLGIPFTDATLSNVNIAGGGSSFETEADTVDAQNLKVMTRWQVYKDSSRYAAYASDPELQKMSHKFHGLASPPFKLKIASSVDPILLAKAIRRDLKEQNHESYNSSSIQ